MWKAANLTTTRSNIVLSTLPRPLLNRDKKFFGTNLLKRLIQMRKLKDLSFGSYGEEGMDIAYFMVVY